MLKRLLTTEFTAEQYLALEDVSETKHEYFSGKIYDMAGGSPDHNFIAGNLITALNQQLANTPCRVFGSDMRILVEASELYTYPDVGVVCGKLQYAAKSKITITNPLILVEVLSPSTRAYDRGDKLKFYKQIPSLREVILIESERAGVEVLRREARGNWTRETHDGLDATMVLKAASCKIGLRQVYAKVTWLE